MKYMIPILVAALLAYALVRRVNPYEAFIRGAADAVPTLILLRPFSGSASLALLGDTLTRYGADSFVGRAASVCVGSTETIFYTLALYCGSVGISKTRHALPAALAGCTAGVVSGILLVRIM